MCCIAQMAISVDGVHFKLEMVCVLYCPTVLPCGTAQMAISVAAQPLDVVHFTVDRADPSSGVVVAAARAAWAATYALNQPVPSFLRPAPHARAKRCVIQFAPLPHVQLC